MIILGIETSCDETAVSVVEATGGLKRPRFRSLAHLVASQAALHARWGGVVPNLAKREHARNLLPLLTEALETAGLARHDATRRQQLTVGEADQVRQILEREPELLDQFLQVMPSLKRPAVDLIAVTQGPGLEPALWVGINLAKALSLVWQIPVVPINHLEGHILSVLIDLEAPTSFGRRGCFRFPALALLISGGHTELVLIKDWLKYRRLGQTRDDAVGEAFDKVARLLGLPYPGGPEISRLAAKADSSSSKTYNLKPKTYSLPRPMLNSPDYDFSFSGLKTAVRYLVEKEAPLSQMTRAAIAHEFQQAAIEVLLAKTTRAVKQFKPATLVIAGGVAANQELRRQFTETLGGDFPNCQLLISSHQLSTDNATMIAVAGYFRAQTKIKPNPNFAAHGTMAL